MFYLKSSSDLSIGGLGGISSLTYFGGEGNYSLEALNFFPLRLPTSESYLVVI